MINVRSDKSKHERGKAVKIQARTMRVRPAATPLTDSVNAREIAHRRKRRVALLISSLVIASIPLLGFALYVSLQ